MMTEKTLQQKRNDLELLSNEIKTILQKLEDNRLKQKLIHRNFASIIAMSTPWTSEKN